MTVLTSFAKAVEDGTIVSVDAFAPLLPGLDTTALFVAPPDAALPDGVTYDPTSHLFSLDTSNAAYQTLLAGQTTDVTVNYAVTDGTTVTQAAVVFTITGTNHAPVVSGPAIATAQEDGGGAVLDRAALLAHASDADPSDTLSIQINDQDLPAGVVYNHVPGFTTVSTTTYYGFTQLISVPTVDTLSIDPSNAAYQSLAAGEELDVVVNYGVSDGHVTSPAQAIFQVIGTNDAPVVSGPLTGAATEGGAVVSISGIANATDIDHGAVLSVVAVPPPPAQVENFINGAGVVEGAAPPPPPILPFDPATLPAGVTFDAATNSFAIDPSDPSFQALSQGQTTTVTVSYGVSDGMVATPASLSFTVTGTNQAPVVSGPVSGVTVSEDAAVASYDRAALLATAHDVDQNDILSVSIDPAQLPDGVTHVSTPDVFVPEVFVPAQTIPGLAWGGYVPTPTIIPAHTIPAHIVPGTDNLSIDPSNAVFQSLAQGEERDVVVNYQVTDGTAATPAQAIFHVIGTNDAPVVTGPVTADATEDGAIVTANALANASDVDHGTVLSLVAAPLPPPAPVPGVDSANDLATLAAATLPQVLPFDPTTLPPGVTLDAATNSFTLDPSNAAYQHLGAGQTETVTVDYGVTDGIAVTAAQTVFTVTGVNDAPVVSGPVTGVVVNEDGSTGLYDRTALLANASDPDSGDTLSIVVNDADLPAGVIYNHVPASGTVVTYQTTYYGITYTVTGVTPVAVDTLTIDPSNAAYQSLAQGETQDVMVSYGVTDGTITTAAQAIFQVVGANDAPVVSGPVSGSATEDGAIATIDALTNATDIDHGTVLSVVAAPPPTPVTELGVNPRGVLETAAPPPPPILPLDPTALPAGVTFDAASNSFMLDPSNAAYQYLSAGQTMNVVLNYGVSDGFVATAATAVFTVTGVNDAPVVSGPVNSITVREDSAGGYTNATLIANATDVDQLDTLTATPDGSVLPAGVNWVTVSGITVPGTGYYAPPVVLPPQQELELDASDPAYQALAQGETMTVTASYGITDGTVTVPATAVFTVVGRNDAPTVSGAVTGSALEAGSVATVNALADASDIDHGSILSITNAPPPTPPAPVVSAEDKATDVFLGIPVPVAPPAPPPTGPLDPASLPAGVTFDATGTTFSLDPSNAAYQYLSAGETTTVTVNYGVTDGLATTAASAVFTVTGVNDAPVVSGPAVGATLYEDDVTVLPWDGGYAAPLDGVTRPILGAVAPPQYLDTIHAFQLLAVAHDPDHLDSLGVLFPYAMPAGVQVLMPYAPDAGFWWPDNAGHNQGWIVTFDTARSDIELQIDPQNEAFQHLAEGEVDTVVVPYAISDGTATVDASATFTIIGRNDAPVVTGPVTTSATENGAAVAVDVLANASDVDDGTVLSVVNLPAALPAGVTYDAISHVLSLDPMNPAFQYLAQGQTANVAVNYGVSDGIVTTAASTVFTVTGVNEAPVVTGPQAVATTEDAATFAFDPFANATDVDKADVLTIVSPGGLPTGVHRTATGYTFNATDPAFQPLAQGEVMTYTWNYGISDGHVTVPTSTTFTVTGVNDAPVISSPPTATPIEDGAIANIAALSHASDVDHGAVLSVVNVPAVLPAGITYDAGSQSFSLDPTNQAFQSLAQGQIGTYAVTYGISDGIATTPTSAIFTVVGVNDAPIVSGPVLSTANEGGAIANIEALLNTTDVDTPVDALRVINVPTSLPAGVTYNATTQKFFLDPTNPAYQYLSLNETLNLVIPYSVTDGYAVVPTSGVFTITGRENAPVISAPVNGGTVMETAAPVTLNLLANATDVDHLDVLKVSQAAGATVTASVTSGTWAAPIAFSVANNQLTIDPSQFAALGLGKTVGVTFNYQVTDGNPGGSVATSANLAVQGVYSGPTGVSTAPTTGSLGKLLAGSGLNPKTPVANITQTGGLAGDTYTYSLGGTGAGSFAVGSSSGVAQLMTGNTGPIGAAAGQLYALTLTANDTNAGLSSPTVPIDVIVGLGHGNNTISVASLPGMVPSTPTFIYDLGGIDTVNASGMTGQLWLDGGQGADIMTGGSGVNDYLYSSTADSTATAMDIITNFHAAADLIDFSGLGTKFGSVVALSGSATSMASTSIGWQSSGGNTFVYVNTGGGSQALASANMKIELQGAVPLTSSNFVHL